MILIALRATCKSKKDLSSLKHHAAISIELSEEEFVNDKISVHYDPPLLWRLLKRMYQCVIVSADVIKLLDAMSVKGDLFRKLAASHRSYRSNQKPTTRGVLVGLHPPGGGTDQEADFYIHNPGGGIGS